MANKEIYIGTATPKSKEVVWIRPLRDGGVSLYAYAHNKWQALKMVDGKGTLPVDDDDAINLMSKEDILDALDAVTGLDAETIEQLKELLEQVGSLADKADGITYDSTNKLIKLTSNGTTLASIDASAFIVDGMVESAEIKDVVISGETVKCLVITFNTDAGKNDVNIPITDFFDTSKYYTKTQTDELMSHCVTEGDNNFNYVKLSNALDSSRYTLFSPSNISIRGVNAANDSTGIDITTDRINFGFVKDSLFYLYPLQLSSTSSTSSPRLKFDNKILAYIEDIPLKLMMPSASSTLSGKIYQYIGETTQSFTHGYFYECVHNGSAYRWEQLYIQPSVAYTAGSNISIVGNTINATDTTYSEATTSTAGLMSVSDKVKLNSINNGAKVSGITMNGSSVTVDANGVVNLGTVLTAHQDISRKEDKITLSGPSGSSNIDLSPQVNYCYPITNVVNTLTITLDRTSVIGATTIIFTTGSSHNITFLPKSGVTIKYQKGISFAANTSYEINCLWIGGKWIVAVNTLSDTLGG